MPDWIELRTSFLKYFHVVKIAIEDEIWTSKRNRHYTILHKFSISFVFFLVSICNIYKVHIMSRLYCINQDDTAYILNNLFRSFYIFPLQLDRPKDFSNTRYFNTPQKIKPFPAWTVQVCPSRILITRVFIYLFMD